MKRSEIEIGGTYVIRVSGKLAPVRITHERTTTAWGTRASQYGTPKRIAKFMGVNVRTGRTIGPFTAAKCRWEIVDVNGRWERPLQKGA